MTSDVCSKCAGPRDRAGQRYCRACHNAYSRAWRARHGGFKAWYATQTEAEKVRYRARKQLARAVSFGRIDRPDRCSQCARVGPVEGHHPDYTKALEVEWLCPSCHRQLHREHRQADHVAG